MIATTTITITMINAGFMLTLCDVVERG